MTREQATPTVTRPPEKELAAAVRGAQEVVVFEIASGHAVAARSFGGAVIDLAWDAHARGLWVLEGDGDGDESRAHRFALGAQDLEWVASSEPFAPSARVLPLGETALLLTEDMGTTWTLLDGGLAVLAPSKLVAKPNSLHAVASRGSERVCALATGLAANALPVDVLVTGSFAGGWHVTKTELAAPGRPESRLAFTPEREGAWLVRKQDDEPRFIVGSLDLPQGVAEPVWAVRSVAGAVGHFEEVVVDVEQTALIALLSRGVRAPLLVLVSLRDGESSLLAEVTGSTQSSAWLGRRLAISRGGALLVATEAAVSSYRRSGSPARPNFERVLELPLLGAPLAVLD